MEWGEIHGRIDGYFYYPKVFPHKCLTFVATTHSNGDYGNGYPVIMKTIEKTRVWISNDGDHTTWYAIGY